jgi:DNA-binding MarR family transcriptional regulator
LLEVHASLTRRLDAALQDRAGVPLGWYDVLVHVDEAPSGRIRLRELEQRVLVSQSTVSRLAVRMEAAGLLARETPDEDRRAVEVHLTAAGMRRLREARAVAIGEVRAAFVESISADDAVQLLRTLAGVRRRIKAQHAGADPPA